MKKIFVFLFCFLSLFSFSQLEEMESLRSRIPKISSDSAAACYARMAYLGLQISPDTVRFYANQALKIASKTKQAYGDALIQIGNSFSMQQNNDSAVNYYDRALTYFKKIENQKGIAKVCQSIAVVFNNIGSFDKAIEKANEALEIYTKLNYYPGIIGANKNIALAYNGKLIVDLSKNKDLNLENSVNKINLLKYTRLALGVAIKNMGDSSLYYQILSDYGIRIYNKNSPDSGMYYMKSSANFLERNNSVATLIPLYLNIASIIKTTNIKLARDYVYKAYKLSEQNNIKDNNYAYILSQLYDSYILESSSKDSINKYLLKFLVWNDSLNTTNHLNLIEDLNLKYETEKKDLQIQNQSLELEAKQKENDAKNKLLIYGTIGLLVVLVFAFIAYANYRKSQRANLIINNQKNQVELQKEELAFQKDLIEEKQKEIIDSITYAQKIQAAVLTGEDVWNKVSPEHFIIFQPKDIVSGDFYWAFNTVNNRSVFVLADCTGHGVPGGFMSMLGNSFLNELVVENKIFKPDEILNKLRQKIISSLGQKGARDRRDGMDMAICTWNKLNDTLEFAGANNKLWLVRNGILQEFEGDKMPVGNYEGELKPFSCYNIQLQKNDLIILCTDGFYDQFGGEKNKKMMSKNLKNIISKNSALPLHQQKSELELAFSKWKGENEQVDDVSLIFIQVV